MYRRGDIILIPIPFTDLKATKVRPVVVISNDQYNGETSDVLVSAITSNLSDKKYSIHIGNSDLKEGALIKPSLIRADKIYSLNSSIVKKKIGRCNAEVLEMINIEIEKLCRWSDE